MLAGHGDDISAQVKINFSSNVWYNPDHSGLKAFLFDNFIRIKNYPEVIPASLNEKIAGFHRLNTANVLVTNGATEAIYLIAQAFEACRTIIVQPSFAEYHDACVLYRHTIQNVPEEQFENGRQHADLVFLCNPNNPTGKPYSRSFIEQMAGENPSVVFVIDEAYTDFTELCFSSAQLIQQYSNIVVLKSLTKYYGIPGLRTGYILASAGIIDKLLRFKLPWSVNSMSLLAAAYIFDNLAAFEIDVNQWLSETRWLMHKILEIPNIECYNSNTTFFLCNTKKGTASQLKEYLLKEYQILIRDASNFYGLGAGNFRLCTQSHANNLILLDGLNKWIQAF
jgi:threonine-phosphate decarboxylase